MKYSITLLCFFLLMPFSFTKSNYACVASLQTSLQYNQNITVNLWGQTFGGSCSVTYSKTISGPNTVTDVLPSSCGGPANGITGFGANLQSSSLISGYVDIYERNSSGQTFIKTVAFSAPSNSQYFSLDGQFHCFGYNFYIHH
jgi:hypothetical protein